MTEKFDIKSENGTYRAGIDKIECVDRVFVDVPPDNQHSFSAIRQAFALYRDAGMYFDERIKAAKEEIDTACGGDFKPKTTPKITNSTTLKTRR